MAFSREGSSLPNIALAGMTPVPVWTVVSCRNRNRLRKRSIGPVVFSKRGFFGSAT